MSKMMLAGGSAVSKPDVGGLSGVTSHLNYKEIINQEVNSQNSSLTGTSWQNSVYASHHASINDPRTSLKPVLPTQPKAKLEQ